jgi:hypothetical protein
MKAGLVIASVDKAEDADVRMETGIDAGIKKPGNITPILRPYTLNATAK